MSGAQLQIMDSREPNTSGPWSRTPAYVESYDYKFKGDLSLTACNIPPAVTDTKTIRVNALKCLPRSKNDTPHLPTGTITVVAVHPGLVNGMGGAVGWWNDLFGTTVTLERFQEPVCQ